MEVGKIIFIVIALIIAIIVNIYEDDLFTRALSLLFVFLTSIVVGCELVYDTSDTYKRAIKEYLRNEYKVEYQYTYQDSILIKTDTIITKIIK